jgi:pimeloyl-ACP methyl ester carboxylesterase
MSTTSPAPPTVVLVHGAFAESSSWNGIIAPLRQAGHTVIAVANPLRSAAEDAAAVRAVVDGVEGPVVLVGHSLGGAAISGGGADHPRVKALVYVAGYAFEVGESGVGMGEQFPGGTLGETLVEFPLANGQTDVVIAQDRYHQQFCADLPAEEAAEMAVTQRPCTAADLADGSVGAAWKTIPSWFLFGDQDKNIPVTLHRFLAERAGARRTEEIAGASHVVGMSHPDALVAMIREAVEATQPVAAA